MSQIQNRLRAISLLCMALAVSGVAWAQSSYTAAVRGVVTDVSGGAIPGATVTVTESDRNVPHNVTTDDAGRYVVTALPPGQYTLSVELTGFRTYTHTNIPLAVQQQATFDVSLEVGEVAETVEVRSQAPLLNITISTLGQVIENRYMTALPNIGRNPLSLLNLTPGVNGAAGTISPSNTNFVANGTRNSTSDVLVDGAIVNTTEQNTGATDLKWTPSVDAVHVAEPAGSGLLARSERPVHSGTVTGRGAESVLQRHYRSKGRQPEWQDDPAISAAAQHAAI